MNDFTELKKENRKRILAYQPTDKGGVVDFFPAYIQLEQTNRCNGECIMCNHFYLGNNGYKDLPMEVINRMESALPYCETLMLNGDGEPFLCKSIENHIARYAYYGVNIGTNTNLCCIPESIWKHFARSFSFLNISCDGATRETFELIRRNLSYDLFLCNLSRLRETAPQLTLNFDCVVMKQNIKELPDIVALAGKYQVESVRFQRLGVNPCINNQDDSAEHFYADLSKALTAAKQVGRECGVRVEHPRYCASPQQHELPSTEYMSQEIETRQSVARANFGTGKLDDDYYCERIQPSDLTQDIWNAGKACRWAIERCYVDVNGNVTTCCFNMKKNMGSLLEQSFEEIWNGAEYRALRQMMAKKQLPHFCRACNWIKESRF